MVPNFRVQNQHGNTVFVSVVVNFVQIKRIAIVMAGKVFDLIVYGASGEEICMCLISLM